MPLAVIEVTASADPLRKRWTRPEYDALSSIGALNDQRLELIEGELIDKMGKKLPHMISAALLMEWAMGVFGARMVLQEPSIGVAAEDNPINEPQPDLVALNREFTRLITVGPPDIRLLIEVSDTSLGFDLTTKAALYARAGILDYWVLDVNARRMIVQRDPQNGRFLSVMAYSADESVAPLSAPDSPFRVRDAFPG